MRTAFYPRLAWDGLRKNGRMAWPYLLTCICMVAIHYIMAFLSSPQMLALLPRGAITTGSILRFGVWVVTLFSLLFLYYTHSFLIRRRAREFGLYHVLGMGKRNLVRIMSWESFFTAAAALGGGLLLGIALSKAAEWGLMKMVSGAPDGRIRLDGEAICSTLLHYAVIFALIWIASVLRVGRSSAVNLMKSDSVGEKPPKGNWALGILGLAILGAAYCLAISVEDPVAAIPWFFAAVLLVIAGTYLLLIAGSVLLCRLLQRNRNYYYRPDRFVSVSSMAYRMKRNGAGLASICIIGTMVLVMLSSSACLWFGSEDALRTSYPREINLEVRLDGIGQLSENNLALFRRTAEKLAAECGTAPDNVRDIATIHLTAAAEGERFRCDYEEDALPGGASLRELQLISAAVYGAQAGQPLSLAEGEAAVLTNLCDFSGETLTLEAGDVCRSFRVVSAEERRPAGERGGVFPSMTVIVPDAAATAAALYAGGARELSAVWQYGFDTGMSDEANIRFIGALEQRIGAIRFDPEAGQGYRFYMLESRAGNGEDFYAANGGLFFIGILLSAVFLLSTVLILYYKQISEGYEDSARFAIMQKVGMTGTEIRRSINTQLRTVFFLPLLLAGVHLLFAFPMIRRLLTLFGLYNVRLFALTTLLSFALFAVFYVAVYRATSRVYYRIVRGAGDGAA